MGGGEAVRIDDPRRALATELVLDGVRESVAGGDGDRAGSSTNGFDTGSSMLFENE